MKLISLHIFKW
jgi:synaptobrevin family protein YKT6